MEPVYASISEFKDFVRIPAEDDTDDAVLEVALAAASRAVDRFTGRVFGSAEDTRVFDVIDGYAIVDDLSRIDEVKLNGKTVTASPWPRNAASVGRPYQRLFFADRNARGEVEVTGLFGWAAVPEAIKQATLLQANRLRARRDAPLGVAGSPETGSELRLLARLDPDVEVLVRGYRRVWGAA